MTKNNGLAKAWNAQRVKPARSSDGEVLKWEREAAVTTRIGQELKIKVL